MNDIGLLFGRPIGQSWDDLKLWETVLNRFDHFKWIVELGTWEGAMALYLFVQCWSRDLLFTTIDKKAPTKETPWFINADVLKKDVTFPLLTSMKSTPGILFCDDGDKPKEVQKYHSLIHPNSFIAVHDWGTEFLEKDIPKSMRTVTNNVTTTFLAQYNFVNVWEASHKEKV